MFNIKTDFPNFYPTNLPSSFSFFSSPTQLKIVGIALTSFAILGGVLTILYFKMTRKARPLIKTDNPPLYSNLFAQGVKLTQQNIHSLKDSFLATIQDFLNQYPQEEYVSFEGLPSNLIPTALLIQLLKKPLPLNTKDLVSIYMLKNSQGEEFCITGFEKALLMQESDVLSELLKKEHKQVTLIPYSDDFKRINTLLRSLYDPKALIEGQADCCALATTSFKLKLNEEGMHEHLDNFLVASFNQADRFNIEFLLDFFKLYQKDLTPNSQQALQKWLNQAIGSADFLERINVLKQHPLSKPFKLDFSKTPISDKDLAHLSGLSLSGLKLEECKQVTDQGLECLKSLSELKELNLKNNFTLTSKGIYYLESLSQLEVLDLSYCYNVKSVGYYIKLNFPNLQVLELINCYNIKNDDLNHFKGHSHLRVLNIKDCYGISDKGIEDLKNLPNLETLTVTGCSNVKQYTIDCFKRKGINVIH